MFSRFTLGNLRITCCDVDLTIAKSFYSSHMEFPLLKSDRHEELNRRKTISLGKTMHDEIKELNEIHGSEVVCDWLRAVWRLALDYNRKHGEGLDNFPNVG